MQSDDDTASDIIIIMGKFSFSFVYAQYKL